MMLKRLILSPVAAVVGFVLGAMLVAAAGGFVAGLGVEQAAVAAEYAPVGGFAGGVYASLRSLGVGA